MGWFEFLHKLPLLKFSRNSLYSLHQMVNTSSQGQFCGWKRLVDEKDERKMARLVPAHKSTDAFTTTVARRKAPPDAQHIKPWGVAPAEDHMRLPSCTHDGPRLLMLADGSGTRCGLLSLSLTHLTVRCGTHAEMLFFSPWLWMAIEFDCILAACIPLSCLNNAFPPIELFYSMVFAPFCINFKDWCVKSQLGSVKCPANVAQTSHAVIKSTRSFS